MTAQTYQMISFIGFILAAVFCVTAVVIWFRFGIGRIIGDLSGRTAKKSIEKMRRENETSGKKSFRPAQAALERGTLTHEIDTGIRLRKGPAADGEEVTELIGEAHKEGIYGAEEADTEDIGSDAGLETIPLAKAQSETAGAKTTLLNCDTELLDELQTGRPGFRMIQDIVLIHTNEVIQ